MKEKHHTPTLFEFPATTDFNAGRRWKKTKNGEVITLDIFRAFLNKVERTLKAFDKGPFRGCLGPHVATIAIKMTYTAICY